MQFKDFARNGTLSTTMNSQIGCTHPFADDYRGRQYITASQRFYSQNLQYASDLVEAEVQGLNAEDFYAYTPVRLRVCSVFDPQTGGKLSNDWQRVMIEGTQHTYLSEGAKLSFLGDIWLCVNPENQHGMNATAVVRRCNCYWHYLDYYGNVHKEPMCLGDGTSLKSTADNVQRINTLPQGSLMGCIQKNEATENFFQNLRIILGKQAYAIRGLKNFLLEHSLDETPQKLIQFDIQIAQTQEEDDLENSVAEGKAFCWELLMNDAHTMKSVEQGKLMVQSRRNGETVESTEERPIAYEWESDAPEKVWVDAEGNMTAIEQGEANVTVRLAQNNTIQATCHVTVEEAPSGEMLQWNIPPHDTLPQFESLAVEAVLYVDGEETDAQVRYEVQGAKPDCYGVQVSGNKLVLTCYIPWAEPITLTAFAGNATLSKQVTLTGVRRGEL